MMPVFADTSYLVAFCGPSDSLHARALELSATQFGEIVTTEYVLVETGGLLMHPDDRPTYLNLVRDLQSDPSFKIVPASKQLFRAGLELFAKRPDKSWSMVDCISFVVMKQRRLKDALTADRHFVQAGFRALLRDDE
jgi:predicted nucleic acid-binding protein